MATKPRYSLETIKANFSAGFEQWLPPAAAAEIIGMTPKWLAAVREGRKDIKGPLYKKLGEGRTSPIVYPLSELLAWMATIPAQKSTLERPIVQHETFGRFMSDATPTDRWLFVISEDRRSATEIFTALLGRPLKSEIQLQWLTRAEYASRRFARAHLHLDAATLEQLTALGNGDPSVGLAELAGRALPTIM
ncbi:MAG: hypothetical protein IPJ12_06850 [Betaproteobacteria bacterium]|mgnify:CR=1 FL=1|nr:hypothetical protein [Betaproteobacteria bacterium]